MPHLNVLCHIAVELEVLLSAFELGVAKTEQNLRVLNIFEVLDRLCNSFERLNPLCRLKWRELYKLLSHSTLVELLAISHKGSLLG